MRIVVLGVTLTRAHPRTRLYAALLAALAARGHDILCLEPVSVCGDTARDLPEPRFCELGYYAETIDLDAWRPRLAAADLVVVGSGLADGAAVIRIARASTLGVLAYYDLDTPATLARLEAGDHPALDPATVPAFDLYLSATGGPVLRSLERRFGARRAHALYGGVDPEFAQPSEEIERRWDLGYIGDYAADRQRALESLLVDAARRLPNRPFVVVGSGYPSELRWPANVERIECLPSDRRAVVIGSLGWSLHIPGETAERFGWTPELGMLEAAVCATPIISAPWRGLATMFTPVTDLLIAERAEDVVRALGRTEAARAAIGRAARARVLMGHTAAHRARLLEALIAEARITRRRRQRLEAL